ncbi:CLIP domain-containing serine protease B9-like [Coccinella septempunctata]|uniref:CLIP domain-containing serine protease B9-like n=1 Tax=Coccinella septempunctata TaxID=41139 RepID=UPI001D085AC5|nr:CLIP domain-containing serine protease B9-like [Coccinella septempunctata]
MIIFSLLLFGLIFNPKFSYGKQWKNEGKCGLAFSYRIVGGSLANSAKYPWIARLGYKTKTKGRYLYLCGGTLINKDFIITAAHCLEYEDKTLEIVRLGETTIHCATPSCEDPRVQQVFVKKTYKHPEFSTSTGFADIALLELGHPVKYTAFVRPICLINRHLAEEGKEGIAAGFGMENYITRERPEGLKELTMKVIPGEQCKKRFPKSDFKSKNYICAGGKSGEDTCNGDSGGPFMNVYNFQKGPRMYLIGVISFGSTKCGVGVPGIFTSVHFHWNWILNNVLK